LVILDEALSLRTFPREEFLPLREVTEVIGRRLPHVHLGLTGHNAHPEVIRRAGLVSEILPVKHNYDKGVPAVKGIEF
jgi:cob(I)alamin adenosyltransferase